MSAKTVSTIHAIGGEEQSCGVEASLLLALLLGLGGVLEETSVLDRNGLAGQRLLASALLVMVNSDTHLDWRLKTVFLKGWMSKGELVTVRDGERTWFWPLTSFGGRGRVVIMTSVGGARITSM